MSTKYKISDQQAMYFVSFAVVDWVDVFSRPLYADILLDSLEYCCIHKYLQIHAWCIMTNHVHFIISASQDKRLSDIIRDMKTHTSKKNVDAINTNPQESRKRWMLWLFKDAGSVNSNNDFHQFWQQDNHPVLLDTNEMIEQRLNYIHNNPVESGLVWEPEDYRYSSAIDYAGGKGLLKLVMID